VPQTAVQITAGRAALPKPDEVLDSPCPTLKYFRPAPDVWHEAAEQARAAMNRRISQQKVA
jgi:hypothetical protein